MDSIIYEPTTAENIDRQVIQWNDRFLLFLIEYQKEDPALRYWLRVADRGERLTRGYWFQGRNYIYIGFSNKGDWYNKTRTIGFVLLLKENQEPKCFLEVVFKAEKDKRLIDCHEDIVKTLGGFEKIEEGKYQKLLVGDDYLLLLKNFIDAERKIIEKVIYKHNLQDILIIPEDRFQKSLDKTLKIRESMDSLDNTIFCILANITWNSKDWEHVSEDRSSHRWVVAGGIPHESWNFDFDNPRNPVDKIYGYVQFTHPPKVKNKKTLVIFYSDSKIVGFYGNATILEKSVPINPNENYNLIADKSLSLVLRNKIEKVKAKGYFEERERVGMVGFIYLKKIETINKIIDEAILLNPKDTPKLTNIREWVNSSGAFINEETENKMNMITNDELSEIPLNQIFYGPPGTGKTYKMLRIIESFKKEKQGSTSEIFLKYESTYWHLAPGRNGYLWEELKTSDKLGYEWCSKEYGDLSKAKLEDIQSHFDIITRFARVREGDYFCIISGKRFYGIAQALNDYNFDLATNNDFDFQTINIRWIKIFEKPELLNISSLPAFTRLNGGERWESVVSALSRNSLYFTEKVSSKITETENYDFITFHQSFTYEDFIEGIKPVIGEKESEDDGTIKYEIRDGLLKQACDKAANQAGYADLKDCLEDTRENRGEKFRTATEYYLFIDEINRGNVSSIFGEFITLIEDDKRLGNKLEMIVHLPYSQEKFGIPPNLYIIGTMNTADRSVEALDTALRRRFSFVEMMPEYYLPQLEKNFFGISLKDLLLIINNRIEKLVDRDHLIGHSYFLNINSGSDLIAAFRDKLIPLLQEYFYGNYEKMGLVMGKGFVEKIANTKVIFADFPSEDYDYNEKIIYRLNKAPFENEENFKTALITLLNNTEVIAESE